METVADHDIGSIEFLRKGHTDVKAKMDAWEDIFSPVIDTVHTMIADNYVSIITDCYRQTALKPFNTLKKPHIEICRQFVEPEI